jgi:hypothetical protein
MITWVIAAPSMVSMSRHPEYKRKGIVESDRRSARSIPVPQSTSMTAIVRTVMGLK